MSIPQPFQPDPAAGRPLPRPLATIICAACEAEEITPIGTLPTGWQVEVIDGAEFAFCPDCARDLPQGGVQ